VTTQNISSDETFGPTLRAWRNHRRMSQLELSLTAEISQRHISWLETGRSRPSRRMVVQLSEALDVPLRDRNRLLNTAGFAPIYHESRLDETQMGAVRSALRRILDQHLPYPALVVNQEWNLLMTNACADALLGQVGLEDFWRAPSEGGESDGEMSGEASDRNLMRLTLHPDGLRPLIANWSEVARHFSVRLRRDLSQTRDVKRRQQLESLIGLAEDGETPPALEPAVPMLPMLTLDLRFGDQLLRLFSVISTFGTAQDVTTDEMRIESFFPLDETSDAILRGLSAA